MLHRAWHEHANLHHTRPILNPLLLCCHASMQVAVTLKHFVSQPSPPSSLRPLQGLLELQGSPPLSRPCSPLLIPPLDHSVALAHPCTIDHSFALAHPSLAHHPRPRPGSPAPCFACPLTHGIVMTSLAQDANSVEGGAIGPCLLSPAPPPRGRVVWCGMLRMLLTTCDHDDCPAATVFPHPVQELSDPDRVSRS